VQALQGSTLNNCVLHQTLDRKFMEDKITGHKIVKVEYLSTNYPPLFNAPQHCDYFDLALVLEMENGASWHIGWTEEERFSVGNGNYTPPSFCEEVFTLDASETWAPHYDKKIVDIDILYVSKALKIPAHCLLKFDDASFVTILLAEEPEKYGTLPVPLRYDEDAFIFVFHTADVPRFEWVQWEHEEGRSEDIQPLQPTLRIGRQRMWAAVLIVLILLFTLYKLAFLS
jgi:hypothetical protein